MLQSLVDALYPKGTRAYMKAGYVRELDDHAIETLVRYQQEATSPNSEIHLHHFGGAVARVPDGQTAYGERQTPYILNVLGMSPQSEGFEAHVDWAHRLYADVEPSLTGGRVHQLRLGGGRAARPGRLRPREVRAAARPGSGAGSRSSAPSGNTAEHDC